MSLKELIRNTIKSRKSCITVYFSNSFLIIIFYWLFFEESEIVYPLCLSLFVFMIYITIEVVKYRNFIENIKDSIVSPHYEASSLNPYEEEIFASIKEVHSEYNKRIYDMQRTIRNKDEMFSQWIHNMKTSITVIDLAYEKSLVIGNDREALEDIKEENLKLKKNLEEALNVLRLEEFSKDYIPEKSNLKLLVNGVVNNKKRDFIYKGVFPKVDVEESIEVYTDKKWCSYMLEQIVDNAIKYSENGKGKKINIKYTKDDSCVWLIIEDFGMGIYKEDMPRIFEPFFTGSNGRKNRTSSGIGLYMVKNICDKLGHKIYVESEIGRGTLVKIKFISNLSKM